MVLKELQKRVRRVVEKLRKSNAREREREREKR
jgi:hypothetical protein